VRDLAVLFLHLLVRVVRLAGPGGARSVIAESVHPGTHRRSRGHETAESHLGLSPDRSADRPGLRDSHHQRCGATHSRRSVPAGTRLGGPVLAHPLWSDEGQSVESRSVSMQIGRPAQPLGSRRHGSMDASHRRLWRASRRRGWRRAVPHVQSSDSRPILAEISRLGPRSAVSVPPMAGESAHTRRQGNQDGAVRAVALSWAVSDADGGVTRVRRICPGQPPNHTSCRPLDCRRVLRVLSEAGYGCGFERSHSRRVPSGVFADQFGIRNRQGVDPMENRQERGSHSLHTRRLFHCRKKRPRTKINTANPSTESDQAQDSGSWNGTQDGL